MHPFFWPEVLQVIGSAHVVQQPQQSQFSLSVPQKGICLEVGDRWKDESFRVSWKRLEFRWDKTDEIFFLPKSRMLMLRGHFMSICFGKMRAMWIEVILGGDQTLWKDGFWDSEFLPPWFDWKDKMCRRCHLCLFLPFSSRSHCSVRLAYCIRKIRHAISWPQNKAGQRIVFPLVLD